MDLKTLQTLQSKIEEILRLMAVDFVEPSVELGEDAVLKINLRAGQIVSDGGNGTNLGILIGSHGETLAAMEYVLALLINRDREEWMRIELDVDGYRERRMQELVGLADEVAARVIRQNESISLHPMPNNERRIVHSLLNEHPQVTTESMGVGRDRRVVVKPR